MKTNPSPQSILHQIAQIPHLEKGTLSVIRYGPNGPYYNHQCYENGKNVSRYVPTDQLPQLKEALEGYQRFQMLVEEYVQLMVQKTRAERSCGLKKNPRSSAGSRAGN